jgi:hypothetical protein
MIKAIGLAFAAALAAAVALILSFNNLVGPLSYKGNMVLAGTSVIGALLIVTLFVERSMGVLNALLFGERQRNVELQLSQATTLDEQAPAAKELATLLGFKERLRLLLGFAAGLFVSAAGIRTLAGLVDPVPNSALFNQVDIVLTAGLIAGGSNGLAFLLQLLKDIVIAPAENADPAPPANQGTRTAAKSLAAPPPPPGPPRQSLRSLRARLISSS